MESKTGSLKLERLTKEFGNGKEKVVAVRELSLTINPERNAPLINGKVTNRKVLPPDAPRDAEASSIAGSICWS